MRGLRMIMDGWNGGVRGRSRRSTVGFGSRVSVSEFFNVFLCGLGLVHAQGPSGRPVAGLYLGLISYFLTRCLV